MTVKNSALKNVLGISSSAQQIKNAFRTRVKAASDGKGGYICTSW